MNLPIIGSIVERTLKYLTEQPNAFHGSENYWVTRYESGGNSGAGSYNELSQFKAEVINKFVVEKGVKTIIEYGCGDGNQLKLSDYPSYIGFDVSQDAIFLCMNIFENDHKKKFNLQKNYKGETAQLTLSLDVVYHLIEDQVFTGYMERLFDTAEVYVIIYSSNTELQEYEQSMHVKHRKFTDWVQNNRCEWKLQQHIPNRHPPTINKNTGSSADFYIYEKNDQISSKMLN